jgi:A/G-specific adenine glycosylase
MSRRTRTPAGEIAPLLLGWYDTSRRDLPWRYAPGMLADPYRVWLSEIMLQQTVVKAVIPYFAAFTTRWPDVAALAAAPLDDVLAAWAGLGYYSRARNLHACAVVVARDHGGHFPADEAALRALPGIGPYTAAAIASIGHGLKATPVDGNVERVTARLLAVREPLPGAKKILAARAATLTPDKRAGDFAQAMMDLGATVCTPRSPSCLICPLAAPCLARAKSIAASLPMRAAKTDRPVRYGTAFVVVRGDGAVLLRRRAEKGLLGGMMEVPSTDWLHDVAAVDASRATPLKASWETLNSPVVHVFTHFRLELTVQRTQVGKSPKLLPAADAERCRWVAQSELAVAALPSLMRKVLAAAGIA